VKPNSHRRINRQFNSWNKSYKSDEALTNDSHYSIERDRGTVKAEKLLETFSRQPKDKKTGKRPMLEPPRKFNGSFTEGHMSSTLDFDRPTPLSMPQARNVEDLVTLENLWERVLADIQALHAIEDRERHRVGPNVSLLVAYRSVEDALFNLSACLGRVSVIARRDGAR
jgi:hypothetical protein